MGVVFAWRIMPGLPYDEPSHWATVEYIGAHHRLPEMTDLGASYEAQQGPVAYVLASLVAGALRGITGSSEAALRAIRLLSGAEMIAATVLAYLIVRRLIASPVGRAVAVSCLALTPMYVAMGWSVQNDALFLALGFTAVYAALRTDGRPAGIADGAAVGVLTGLAILTKLTAFPLLIAYPTWLVLRWGIRRAAPGLAAFIVTTAMVCGWWFLRNLLLYDKLTPPTTVNGVGPSFPAYGFHGPSTIGHMIQDVVAYLWVPTEYYRNLITLPSALKAVLGLATLAIIFLGVAGLRRDVVRDGDVPRRSTWLLVGLLAGASVTAWTVTVIFVSSVAPRFGYLALPCWIGLVGMAVVQVRRLLPRLSPVLVVGVPVFALLLLDAWVLWSVRDIAGQPFLISFG